MSSKNRITSKISAIDIGSNGARMLINRVLLDKKAYSNGKLKYSLKNVEYVRFPLRLGIDVFKNQKITEEKQVEIIKLMTVFKLLNDLHQVDDCLTFATSAFREAQNGKEVVDKVKTEVGIEINVISGKEEASVLQRVINKYVEASQNYLHIDVGGGSTEINFYQNRAIVASQSFDVGTVRNADHSNNQAVVEKMQKWLQTKIKNSYNNILAIGTGGNINKIASFANAKSGQKISFEEIKAVSDHLENFSFDDKINVLKLNPDRADTIVPASKIYLSAMKWGGANKMIVPKVGLKDGMMEILLEKNLNKELIKK